MAEEMLCQEIAERASTTNWTDKKFSKEVWNVLFEAARRAPSSWNHQPARYIAIHDKHAMEAVGKALHRTNHWATSAAGLIVQFADPNEDDRVGGKDYYLYDCGLAMMSLVYQAQSMGITTRQMIGWDEQELKRILQVPEPYRIVVVAALGYPSDSTLSNTMADTKRHLTGQHKRIALDELVSYNKFQGGRVK